jgi:major membrane immunogen (membrane-anchored lipoprotein)
MYFILSYLKWTVQFYIFVLAKMTDVSKQVDINDKKFEDGHYSRNDHSYHNNGWHHFTCRNMCNN